MKRLGIERHNIEDMHSYFFHNIKIVDMDYIAQVQQEIRDEPKIENSLYYQGIMDNLRKYGKVFGSIVTKRDAKARFDQFRQLVKSIAHDYRPEWDYEMQEGLPYGAITGVQRDGKILIVDGHHRLAILYALGYKRADVLVFDENGFWYQDRYPVDMKLDMIDYNWKDKRVLDLGCNLGDVGKYVMDRGAIEYDGVDTDEAYIKEAKIRHPEMSLSFHLLDAEVGTKMFSETNVVVALGLFHHMPNKAVKNVIDSCKGDIIFECPTGEKEYSEYRVRTRQWYLDLMLSKGYHVRVMESGMPLDKSYPFERLTFICTK